MHSTSFPSSCYALRSALRSARSGCADCRPASDKTSEARGLFPFSAVKPSGGIRCRLQARPGCAVSGRKPQAISNSNSSTGNSHSRNSPDRSRRTRRKSRARIHRKSHGRTRLEAASISAPVKTAGLGSPSADRRGERESYNRGRQQQLTGHETLLLRFLIRFDDRIAGMYAVTRARCLPKTDEWPDGIECRFCRSGVEWLGSRVAVHDASRLTGKLILQARNPNSPHSLE